MVLPQACKLPSVVQYNVQDIDRPGFHDGLCGLPANPTPSRRATILAYSIRGIFACFSQEEDNVSVNRKP